MSCHSIWHGVWCLHVMSYHYVNYAITINAILSLVIRILCIVDKKHGKYSRYSPPKTGICFVDTQYSPVPHFEANILPIYCHLVKVYTHIVMVWSRVTLTDQWTYCTVISVNFSQFDGNFRYLGPVCSTSAEHAHTAWHTQITKYSYLSFAWQQ